jgi:hypothetical protein
LPKPNDHNPTAASLGFRTAPRPGPPSQPALTPTGIGTPTQPRRARFHPPCPPPQQIDVLLVDGSYYGFSGCHRFEAHQRLGVPTIRCRVRKASKEILRMHMM